MARAGMLFALLSPVVSALFAFVHRSRWSTAVSLPVAWVGFEFARKHLGAVVDGTGMPYGQLGLTQAGFPRLIQIADLGGVYAVSAVVAAASGWVVDTLCWMASEHKQKRTATRSSKRGLCDARRGDVGLRFVAAVANRSSKRPRRRTHAAAVGPCD